MRKSKVLVFFALYVALMTVISVQSDPAQACLVDPCPSDIDGMGGVSIINHIKSGKSFTVTFDKVGSKFNDSGWEGNTDPMGTLKAGETYQVTYSSGKYTTRGFNESTNSVISATYGNANPDKGKISLWGRVQNPFGIFADEIYSFQATVNLAIQRFNQDHGVLYTKTDETQTPERLIAHEQDTKWVLYTFDGNRNVYDPQFGLVGTLRFQ